MNYRGISNIVFSVSVAALVCAWCLTTRAAEAQLEKELNIDLGGGVKEWPPL
jgi:hypothetical protein